MKMRLHHSVQYVDWHLHPPTEEKTVSLSLQKFVCAADLGHCWTDNQLYNHQNMTKPPLFAELTSDGVDGHVDPKAHVRVGEGGPDVILEEVPDAVELHDVGGLLAQPELVELDEEVAVQVVEVRESWPAREIESRISEGKTRI